MDNIAMNNANICHPVHHLPKGIRAIHRKYGLWICKFARGNESKPEKPENIPFRHFEFYDLSHMFDGNGWYSSTDGKIKEIEKSEGVLIVPGFKHKYGGCNEPYIEDAISFCGPMADHLFNAGTIKNGILKIGKARRLLPIIELAIDNSDDSQIKANMELQKLLVDLYFENKHPEFLENPAFEQLLVEIKKSPGKYWSLVMMTDFCNLSVSQLNRMFKKKTGMTSKDYIDNIRMHLASEMLASGSKTIKEIAAVLGYADPYHFSRRFKELKAYSPKKYKELFIR